MPHIIDLPDDSELDVPLVPLSSSTLMAGAFHLGRQCDQVNKEFMLCKQEEKDPRKCLNEGREVTKCVTEFFHTVKGSCAETFADYMTCLDYNELGFPNCRKQQGKFDSCMEEKLDFGRPEVGKISQRNAIVKTDRPVPVRHQRPKPEPTHLPVIPPKEELEASKTGARFFFW